MLSTLPAQHNRHEIVAQHMTVISQLDLSHHASSDFVLLSAATVDALE
jgi:hypothetical protein